MLAPRTKIRRTATGSRNTFGMSGRRRVAGRRGLVPSASRRVLWRGAISTAVVVASLGLVAPHAEESSAAALSANLHTLVVARDLSDARTMDPDRLFEPTAGVVAGNTYDTLVTFHGEDLTHPQPVLATRWTISPSGRKGSGGLRGEQEHLGNKGGEAA